jgi:peroxiredoxin
LRFVSNRQQKAADLNDRSALPATCSEPDSPVEFAHQTLTAYGVWQAKMMYGKKKMGIVRSTYLIDPAGRVKHVFPKVKAEDHIHDVLAALKG